MGALYMECSSKEMTGVHEIFETAINTVVAEQEGLLKPVESNTKKTFGNAKREGVTSSGSSSGAGGAQQQRQQQPQQMLAPSKKKKRSACLIL